uniref:Uncharacterized protein n=1 Tax=Chaetoceros debilis TaxID=122233 RepID=A0A7S3QJV7_9STRA|mmetsp:Transcript_9327/g.13943  ORF Transcript_9327/g.13943 Transcript_9327/m.13943 type:complete len:408 (+) Transcript_9327:211-1434(+)|eukprot:CAMPEP_0194119318 /NCGR_PEP_ID=MMETSP0150-20130528/38876_1 /TAXON_ID=122233 /ORGANISM="Chaetoceros debilis, Strain MM31A-1" /LENGTH=407 /DNA_ID=CAMNT_0038810983 /DNA_START=115 /DNA_END=1338 /DNA_ORIENTATION=+
MPSDSESSDDDSLDFSPFLKKRKVKHSSSSDDHLLKNDNQQETVEDSAKRKAQIAYIPKEKVTRPSLLGWSKKFGKSRQKKKQADYYPCRECHPDEGIGLDIDQGWDRNKKVLVQFIEGTEFTSRALISRNQLIPFDNGEINGNSENIWSPQLMNNCMERLRKDRRKKLKEKGNGKGTPNSDRVNNEPDLFTRSMELYMQRVLGVASQEELTQLNKEKELKLTGETEPSQPSSEQESSSNLSQASAIVSQSQETILEDSSSDDDCNVFSREKRKCERLRSGDVIEYYAPIGVFGDKRFHRQTTVQAVNPQKKDFVLELENGEFIPKNCKVRRIEMLLRGKKKDVEGSWKEIQAYKLLKARMKNQESSGITCSVKRIKAIVSKNQQEFLKKSKELGMGDATDFMAFKR